MPRFAQEAARQIWLAVLLVLASAAGGPALAAFPNCQPPLATPNPPLEPDAQGNYAAQPALPFAGTHTVWRVVNRIQIERRTGTATTLPFIVNGVNYAPTQIGGSGDLPPYNDLFYTNDTGLWPPLWDRDIATMRAIGVNAMRTYGFWKFEPGFAGAPPRPAPTGVAEFWPLLDIRILPDQAADRQFCFPGDPAVYAFEHRSHTAFLDRLWNGGGAPIHIWIAIALPLALVDAKTPPAQREQYLQFYRYSARWLARMYGNHPAVMGFVIGNELDTASTTRTRLFWDTLNDIGRVVKASAPDKLTMSVFHDTPDFNAVVADAPGQPRGPQMYGLDIYGFNPFNTPAPDGNLFSRFRDAVAMCTRKDGASCAKPLLFGEFGVPADMHARSANLASNTYPVPWAGVNFIWRADPAVARCLTASDLTSPPGPGGKGPETEFNAKATIGVELPQGAQGAYDLPASLAGHFPGFAAGTHLGAAAQADWLADFLQVAAQYRVDPAAPPAAKKFNSGGFVFEWRDEWWKGNENAPYFHSISGNDTCGPGCPAGCDTGLANPVFPGGWGDEQWFGVTGAAPYQRAASASVTIGGVLNGGPDRLEPRAAVVAICRAFGGPACR